MYLNVITHDLNNIIIKMNRFIDLYNYIGVIVINNITSYIEYLKRATEVITCWHDEVLAR